MVTKRISVLLIALALATSAGAQPRQTKAQFHDAMRQLWSDHVTWTRFFIISAAADLPDKAATTQRLLQDQNDIGARRLGLRQDRG